MTPIFSKDWNLKRRIKNGILDKIIIGLLVTISCSPLLGQPLSENQVIIYNNSLAEIQKSDSTSLVIPDTSKKIEYPSFIGIAASIFPGVLLHGSGHYVAGNKKEGLSMLKWSGIGLGTTIAGLVGMGLTGGADELMPILIPVTFMGFGVFMSTWLLDIMGTANLHGTQELTHPYQETYFLMNYVDQDNNRNNLSRFINYQSQIGFDRFFVQLNYEHELDGKYNEFHLKGGYNLLQKKDYQLYIIPEFKYRHSSEGFGIYQGHLLGELELNMGNIWKSLDGIYFTNELGYGTQIFQFNNSNETFTNSLMIIGQGLRIHASKYLDISSRYKRREDELVGGRDFGLFYYEHGIRVRVNRLFSNLLFTHGQGYRLKLGVGYSL